MLIEGKAGKYRCWLTVVALGHVSVATAQVEIAVFGGGYFDRSNHVLRMGSITGLRGSLTQFNAPGAGLAVGGRASFILNPYAQLELSAVSSGNRHYGLVERGTPPPPDPDWVARKLTIMPQLGIVPTGRSKPIEVAVLAGGVFIASSGSGDLFSERRPLTGGAFSARVRWRATRQLGVSLTGSTIIYGGEWPNAATAAPPVGTWDQTHVDGLVVIGVDLRFGRIPAVGVSHGPGVVPSRNDPPSPAISRSSRAPTSFATLRGPGPP